MDAGDRILALFDVDETLIATKSMFDFLSYFNDRYENIDAPRLIERVQHLSRSGAPRESVNLEFWQGFKGVSRLRLISAAGCWTQEKLKSRHSFLIDATYEKLKLHRERRHHVALVSGSSIDILEPLAREFGVDYVLATRQLTADGIYTGHIAPPVMIGAGKRAAAKKLAMDIGADLSRSFAYGDHITDLAMLESVGNPVVVGTADAELQSIAVTRGWQRLPSTTSEDTQWQTV